MVLLSIWVIAESRNEKLYFSASYARGNTQSLGLAVKDFPVVLVTLQPWICQSSLRLSRYVQNGLVKRVD